MEEQKINAELREREAVASHWKQYLIHNYFVKPLFSNVSNRLRTKILKLIQGFPKTVLDVACGDDRLIFDIAEKYNIKKGIANDLSIKLVHFIDENDHRIVYTNYNILDEPFNEHFDLVVCKNTLHHIPLDFQLKLVEYLVKIGDQVLIIDIEDPRNSTVTAYLWNCYYRLFLGDSGDTFLKYDGFCELLNKEMSRFSVGKIKTLKGNYMYGIYKKDDNS